MAVGVLAGPSPRGARRCVSRAMRRRCGARGACNGQHQPAESAACVRRAAALAASSASVMLCVTLGTCVRVLDAHAQAAATVAQAYEGGSLAEEDEDSDLVFPPSPYAFSPLRPRGAEVLNLSRTSLKGADYSSTELTGAVFAESELSGADFSGSDVRGAVFSRGVMDKARLVGSDASDALFDYVVLRGSDMRQSLFQNANFIRADVEETDIDGADFTDAVLDRYQLRGLCEHATGMNKVTKRRTFDSLQCSEVLDRAYKGFGPSGREVIVAK